MSDDKFSIAEVSTIDVSSIRGGAADKLLWQCVVATNDLNRNNSKIMVDALKSSESTVTLKSTYFKCRHCDVVQKEFHPVCPQCGAPMVAEEKFVSEAVPITSPADVGQSYKLNPDTSFGAMAMAAANFGRY